MTKYSDITSGGCMNPRDQPPAEAQAQGGGEDNQCDGCCAGYGERNGIHVLPDGTPYMACQSGRYAPPSAPVGNHTAEPWLLDNDGAPDEDGFAAGDITITDAEGLTAVAEVCAGLSWGEQHSNARRIVACVNACAGIPTERLEEGIDWIKFQSEDDRMFAEIEAAAKASFHRHRTSCRGQTLTRADNYESHLVWATLEWAKRTNGAEQRAERLAEALRLAMDWNWLDEDARPSRTAEICDAALEQERRPTMAGDLIEYLRGVAENANLPQYMRDQLTEAADAIEAASAATRG